MMFLRYKTFEDETFLELIFEDGLLLVKHLLPYKIFRVVKVAQMRVQNYSYVASPEKLQRVIMTDNHFKIIRIHKKFVNLSSPANRIALSCRDKV